MSENRDVEVSFQIFSSQISGIERCPGRIGYNQYSFRPERSPAFFKRILQFRYQLIVVR